MYGSGSKLEHMLCQYSLLVESGIADPFFNRPAPAPDLHPHLRCQFCTKISLKGTLTRDFRPLFFIKQLSLGP
jgi:hypothetical protein